VGRRSRSFRHVVGWARAGQRDQTARAESRKIISDVIEVFIGHRIDSLDLERLHEALRLGIVVRVAAPAHRADKAVDIGEIHIPKDMLVLAEHILDSKAADFDASKFHDRYEAAVVAIINEKKAGLPVSVQRQILRIVAGTDLMAALRQSIEAEAPKAKAVQKETPVTKTAPPPKGKKQVKRNPDQREMLLPIAGTGPAKEAVEQPAKSSTKKKAG